MYNPQKLFGVTMLDVIRAETFVANFLGRAAGTIRVNVIGGHSGKTILPVMSQVGGFEFTDEEAAALVRHIQDAGTEVVDAKAGNGSATLAMAAAGYRFINAVVRGLMEEENVIECAYVEGGSQHSRFFSQPMRLGKEGWYKVLPYGPLTQAEKDSLDLMLPTLRDEIRMGEDFVLKPELFQDQPAEAGKAEKTSRYKLIQRERWLPFCSKPVHVRPENNRVVCA